SHHRQTDQSPGSLHRNPWAMNYSKYQIQLYRPSPCGPPPVVQPSMGMDPRCSLHLSAGPRYAAQTPLQGCRWESRPGRWARRGHRSQRWRPRIEGWHYRLLYGAPLSDFRLLLPNLSYSLWGIAPVQQSLRTPQCRSVSQHPDVEQMREPHPWRPPDGWAEYLSSTCFLIHQ